MQRGVGRASAQPSPPWGELEFLSPATARVLSTTQRGRN